MAERLDKTKFVVVCEYEPLRHFICELLDRLDQGSVFGSTDSYFDGMCVLQQAKESCRRVVLVLDDTVLKHDIWRTDFTEFSSDGSLWKQYDSDLAILFLVDTFQRDKYSGNIPNGFDSSGCFVIEKPFDIREEFVPMLRWIRAIAFPG